MAIIQLTARPELSTALSDSDWEAEGFAYMEENGLLLFGGKTPTDIWDSWKLPGGLEGIYVVRFQLVKMML